MKSIFIHIYKSESLGRLKPEGTVFLPEGSPSLILAASDAASPPTLYVNAINWDKSQQESPAIPVKFLKQNIKIIIGDNAHPSFVTHLLEYPPKGRKNDKSNHDGNDREKKHALYTLTFFRYIVITMRKAESQIIIIWRTKSRLFRIIMRKGAYKT